MQKQKTIKPNEMPVSFLQYFFQKISCNSRYLLILMGVVIILYFFGTTLVIPNWVQLFYDTFNRHIRKASMLLEVFTVNWAIWLVLTLTVVVITLRKVTPSALYFTKDMIFWYTLSVSFIISLAAMPWHGDIETVVSFGTAVAIPIIVLFYKTAQLLAIKNKRPTAMHHRTPLRYKTHR